MNPIKSLAKDCYSEPIIFLGQRKTSAKNAHHGVPEHQRSRVSG